MSEITATENWFVATEQMPQAPTPDPRQIAFYLGMQVEELLEKLLLAWPSERRPAILTQLEHLADGLKRGDYDEPVWKAVQANPGEWLDGDMDQIWVSIGSARAQGANVLGAYSEVIFKNWDKKPPELPNFICDPDTGKVLKRPDWLPPDHTPFIHESLRGGDAESEA